MPEAPEAAELPGNCPLVSKKHAQGGKAGTHKRLEYCSMLCKTENESRTVRQMVEKERFFHRLFGISAGFPILTCRCTQMKKAGAAAALNASRKMLEGSRILWI